MQPLRWPCPNWRSSSTIVFHSFNCRVCSQHCRKLLRLFNGRLHMATPVSALVVGLAGVASNKQLGSFSLNASQAGPSARELCGALLPCFMQPLSYRPATVSKPLAVILQARHCPMGTIFPCAAVVSKSDARLSMNSGETKAPLARRPGMSVLQTRPHSAKAQQDPRLLEILDNGPRRAWTLKPQ